MKRPLAWSTIFMICGIYMRLGISEMVCLAFFIAILMASLYFVIKCRNERYLLLLLFVPLGFFAANARMERMEIGLAYGAATGMGVVQSVGTTTSGNQRLGIRGTVEDAAGGRAEKIGISAIWTGEERFSVGDRVAFSGELAAPSLATYPGGYDEAYQLAVEGYACKIFPEEIQKTGAERTFGVLLAEGRERLHRVIEQILPANEGGILKALVTGEHEDIPEETRELYTKAGVIHILCISGLHLSLLGFYIEALLSRVLRCGRGLTTAAILLLSALFLCFTGITPSAVRAVLMMYVLQIGKYLFCLYDRRSSIAAAAMLILLFEPLYLFHAGFQLSFVTVLGICIGAERLEQSKGRKRSRLDGIKELLLLSFYASIWSFPLVAYHFYSVSLVGVLANLVILPLSGLLLGFGILSAVLGLFSIPLATFAAGSVYIILQIYEKTCRLLTSLPFASVLVGRPTVWVIALYGMLLLLLLYGAERKWSWLGGAAICAAMWCCIFGNRMLWKENLVTFLDVGQGDAAVITTYDKRACLIDGGGIYGRDFGENTGELVILPYLQSLGIDRLDGAFLSHMDRDHMFGLLEAVDALPTEALYLPDYPMTEEDALLREVVERRGIPLYTLGNGAISADGAWGCLYPFSGLVFETEDSNLSSLVLRYRYGGTDILFTGDLPELGERLLLQKGVDVSADVLKVSHHGSRGATTEEFLRAVRAREAVISCGQNNLYGHPHDETLARLEQADVEVERTDEEGSIFLRLTPHGERKIQTMADRQPFYERLRAGDQG